MNGIRHGGEERVDSEWTESVKIIVCYVLCTRQEDLSCDMEFQNASSQEKEMRAEKQ